MGPVVNNAATANKSGDSRPNNSSNHGPSSHGSYAGGNHSKNYGPPYRQKPSHTNNQNHRQSRGPVNNQQATQPGRQHHHHNHNNNNINNSSSNNSNNNVPPPSQNSQQQQQPQSLPQPSQHPSATMFVPSQQQPSLQHQQLQHQQQQKPPHNHQASVTNPVNATNNAGNNNMSITPTNKNSQTSSNVLQQQHTSSQQQPTIQMPIAPDKTSTGANHNPHMVHHQQPTPTSTSTGVGSVNINQPHMPSAQPNMPPNLSHHQHLTPHHGHAYHHHQQQQPHHHHHHHHIHHQPNQTQNPHHHNIHNPHNAHPQSHAGQMVGAQMPVTSIISSIVAPNQNKLPPQVLQQPTQNQDSSGQQKQQSNQPPQATVHVSSPHSIVDHQHKTASGIQHNVQSNPLMLHQPINQQANPNHSNHPHMTNLQSSPITHQSASGVAPMQQPQQQQPTTHNQPHIQQPSHHPHMNQPQQQYFQMHPHPAFLGFSQGPSHQSQFHQLASTLNPTGVPLGPNNHLGAQPNMHYTNASPKFSPINQSSFPPHQQNIPTPNASGALLHPQPPQMHAARQAPTKGPLQMQQQQHDAQSRPPIYSQNYYAIPQPYPYFLPYSIQQQNSGFIPPHVGSNEDPHLTSAYTSPQPVGQGSHMAAISVSQPGHIPHITQLVTQPNISTSNHPTSASSHPASFPRVKESKKISIVDPKTGRALTKEQLLAPTAKTGSVTSSTPATDDLTRSSISGSPEVRPTSASTSSSPVEQSGECSASATEVAGPTKPDDKVDSDLDKAQPVDISEESVTSLDEKRESLVVQEQSDVSVSTEPNQIVQDVSKTEVVEDKDETSKIQALDVCDNAAASMETISTGLQRLNLADSMKIRSDSNKISSDVAEKLDRQSTDICPTGQNSVVSHTSDDRSKEKTLVDEDSSEGRTDGYFEATSDKQSNHDLARKESLENNLDVGSNISRTLHLDLGGEELSADKDSISSSFPSSNKLSSMPQSEASTPTQNEEKESKQENATPESKSQLTYEEGQFSPTNPNGRKKYSRDFLRKVALIMGIPFQPRPMSVRSNEQKEPPNFAPPFLMNSGYNQFNRDTAQRRLSQQVNNKPRRIIATSSYQQEVELKTAKNPWKPDLAKSPNETEAEKIDTDRLIKIFRGHLNKLTPQKYDQLIEKIKLLDLGTNDRMNRVIDLVFDKAVDEPNFCELYANLCKVVGTKTTDDSSQIFGYALVKKCQKEFENEDIYDGLNVIERQLEIDATSDPQKRKQLMDELYEEQRLRRRKYLGTIKLIGEMYKLDLLLPVIIGVCMHRLIESPTSENLECLCSLILTVGAKLSASEEIKVREGLNNTLTAMQNIATNKANLEKLSLDVRIKFKILDIIEFRKRGWKPRNQENNPKKIDEIHREAAQETLLKNSISQRNLADRKNDDRMRKVSARPYEQPPSLLSELAKNNSNTNQTSRLSLLTTESSNSVQSLKPHSYSRPSPMNHSSPNQNSDVTRLVPLNPPPPPNSINTSKPNPESRQTNPKPITTQSNVKGSSSLNPKPANKINSNPISSDRHTEYQSTESISVENEDMVIQMIRGCVSKYDGQFMLEKERLTEHSKTILSLLHKGDVSNDSLISGITDYVEQLDYPTHLLGDIFEHMITEGLLSEADFSTRFAESRWSKARDSSPKFIRYLSEPDHFRKIL